MELTMWRKKMESNEWSILQSFAITRPNFHLLLFSPSPILDKYIPQAVCPQNRKAKKLFLQITQNHTFFRKEFWQPNHNLLLNHVDIVAVAFAGQYSWGHPRGVSHQALPHMWPVWQVNFCLRHLFKVIALLSRMITCSAHACMQTKVPTMFHCFLLQVFFCLLDFPSLEFENPQKHRNAKTENMRK